MNDQRKVRSKSERVEFGYTEPAQIKMKRLFAISQGV
jgi:hypothetical protein